MNKTDLIASVSELSGLTKKKSALALDAFMKSVQIALTNGESVTLVGFGTFKIKERESRKVMNPRTKEFMTIPKRKHAGFKAGKNLKTAVN